jgi:hypothetical protein
MIYIWIWIWKCINAHLSLGPFARHAVFTILNMGKKKESVSNVSLNASIKDIIIIWKNELD